MSKKFLSVGDILINPDLLTYAVVEDDGDHLDGLELRLGFASPGGSPHDLRLRGEAAGEVLRWLRLNADFLGRPGTFGPNAPLRPARRDSRRDASAVPAYDRPPAIGRSPELIGRY
ncbi:hypothetical protein [Paludisphaera soli]|uniref:hypothetical protein n=1 Tax=Paludisphaera soli TaxID=2712865 RepID=UPI0013EC4753|nr:hypothetical protein [Paludisphaera soli]